MVRTPLYVLLAAALLVAGCSDTTEDAEAEPTTTASEDGSATAGAGVRVVSPVDGAAIAADPPADLIVLDVRTADEFADGHLDGAIMLDFYAEDFADRVAQLDPDVPYLLYCRSGNRSGQTAALMADLGFSDVADIDGGILAWSDAGLEIVGG